MKRSSHLKRSNPSSGPPSRQPDDSTAARPALDLASFDNANFDRGAARWVELLWLVVRGIFFFSRIPLPSAVKVFWLRAFGAKVGRGVVVRSRVNVTFPWRLECGDYSWIGDEVLILSLAPVKIGSHVCVSQRAFLCTGSHDFDSSRFTLVTAPITIGDGSWVCAQAFVGPGVELGAGSRCLPCSAVSNSVGPGITVGGVPARAVRMAAGESSESIRLS
jgi:putative colanic acid biosynthesis acetyltransferase WcaF